LIFDINILTNNPLKQFKKINAQKHQFLMGPRRASANYKHKIN